MTYEKFAVELMKEIKEKTGYHPIRKEIHKVNKVKDGILINVNQKVTPMIYLEDYYQEFKVGKSIQCMIDEMIKQIQDGNEYIPTITRESAEENLTCGIIGRKGNEELLKGIPYQEFEDLAIIFKWKIGENACFIVQNYILSVLGWKKSQLMEAALENTRKQGYVINDKIFDGAFWVLSNESGIDGAVTMLLEEALEEIHERFHGNYYILPSSRHELVLIPAEDLTDAEKFREMVKEVNETAVDIEDKLSDSIYYYDGKKLSLV